MSLVVVTGGTGTLGRRVVERLVAAGRPVRVVSRRQNPDGLPAGAEFVRADLRRRDAADVAVAGAAVVVQCATTYGPRDVELTRNVVAAAQSAGWPHIVYVSIVGVDRIPIFYYRAKLEAERLLASSGLPWTVQRATQFHDLVAWLLDLQRRSPVIVVPLGVRVQPVDVRDVATRLACLADGAPAGRVADIGGPEVHELRVLAAHYQRVRGGRRPVLPVRFPGAAIRAYRAGANLAPGNAVAGTTFTAYLTQRP
ncbi:SDR family oxidoreductase [Pseudonocardia alaniniphila]|uniref:NAD(P)H-binding protein n=1 Tax=Pseudonocardia alaniniphila TaxID=75291 RepID=A0ABS9T7G3_9PSEU|nr:NAD(P)H-binding protein [Pseudonocardia alaniniphila]MCH6164457.1 NAD(P)H-binding protein [Pseudonocardia alaniniphila]